jgi:Xaa-Pro dipeptidase
MSDFNSKESGSSSRRGFVATLGVSAAAPWWRDAGHGAGLPARQRGSGPPAGGAVPPFDQLPSLRERITPIPEQEYLERQENARRRMAEAKLDAILLTGGSSLLYFAGFNWGRSERLFAAALPRRGEIIYICPAFERRRAEEQMRFGKDLRVWEEDESPYALLRQALRERGARRLGMEETSAYFVSAGLAREAPQIEQAPADPVTAGCRMRKSPRELALMEVAGEATRKAVRAAFTRLGEGMTPRQLSELIAAAHAQQGVRGGFALVGLGQASAFPHGSSMTQQLRKGDMVLVDTGCSVEGYQSDLTRTIVFGPPSDRQRQVWETVKKAQSAALAAARPGVAAEAVDRAARSVIEDAGFGPGYKFFTHRLGHGIGLDGHEWPYIVRGNKLPLQPGMTFSDEPGIYIHGEFGVRLEDVMTITETGARLLTLQTQAMDEA